MLIYGEAATTFSEPAILTSYCVPPGQAFKAKSFIGWGDVPGEFEIFLNNNSYSGCRTSNEKRTEQIWWGDAFICNPEDEIIVMATHYVQGLRKLKCNIELMRI